MAQPRTGPRRWLTPVLIVSLALNLLVLGMVAGALLRRPEPHAAAPGLWYYGRALPEPYRHDLARALRASRDDWIGPHRQLRGQRSALAAALTAEPFEIDEVREVLSRETRLADELAARGTAGLIDQIERMDAAARAAYAEALTDAQRWRRDRDRR